MKRLSWLFLVLVMVASVSALPSKICYPLSTGLFCFNSTDVSGLSIVNGLDSAFSTNGIMVKTAAGTYTTVDNNSTRWNTAFGWGNHAVAGYAAQTTLLNVNTTLLDVIAAVNGTALKSVPYQSSAAGWTNTSTNISTLLDAYFSNNVYIGQNGTDGDKSIYFYDNSDPIGERIYWSESNGDFRLTDDAVIQGRLAVDSDLYTSGAGDNIWAGTSTEATAITSNVWLGANGTGRFGDITIRNNATANYFFGNLNASYIQNEPWTAQINTKAGVPTDGLRTNEFDGVRQGGQTGNTFDAINDYISIADILNTSLPFSMLFFINPTSFNVDSRNILSVRNGGNTLTFRVDTSQKLFAEIWNTTGSATINTNYVIPLNLITQVGLTYNSTNISLYVNGTQVYNVGFNNVIDYNNVFEIANGYGGANRFFNGSIYSAKFWNRSLSAGEVASEYALGASTPTTNTRDLVLQYCLNCTDPEFSNSTHVFNVLGASRTDQVLAERISAVNASALQVVNNSINVTNKIFATSIFGDSANPNIVLSNANGGYLKYSTNYYQVGSSSLSLATANTNRVTINAVNTTFSNIPVSKNFTLSNETGHAYCVKIVGAALSAVAGGC